MIHYLAYVIIVCFAQTMKLAMKHPSTMVLLPNLHVRITIFSQLM